MALEIYKSKQIGKSESKRTKHIWQVEQRGLLSGTESQPGPKKALLDKAGKPVGQSVQAMPWTYCQPDSIPFKRYIEWKDTLICCWRGGGGGEEYREKWSMAFVLKEFTVWQGRHTKKQQTLLSRRIK